MNRTNAITLLIILISTALVMLAIRMIVFPQHPPLAVAGIGSVAVILMLLNRRWLAPGAPAMPRMAVLRSIAAALILGIGMALLFGAMAV